METQSTITVLIVDDDASYVAIVQALLSKFQGRKFEVVWRQEGKSAIAELEKNPSIDLVLIDYYLPEMNGLEVTRSLRAMNAGIPIIFLTSSRDFRLAIEVMKYGVEDYMVKDDAMDSVLPRSIINILERVALKRRIAEQQKADLIARKRTEAIKELVVTVCHEFNNPLAAIKISADILARQDLAPEDKRLVAELDNSIGLVEREISRLRDINFEKVEF